MSISYLGLRSLIYPAPQLSESKAWWSKTLGKDPYFDDGGGIILADIESPTGEVFGVIFNPHFKV